MKPDSTPRRAVPAKAATRAEESTTASEDQGAEVATRAERPTAADDYEANARLDDEDPQTRDDVADDTDTYDRPDSAAIADEEE